MTAMAVGRCEVRTLANATRHLFTFVNFSDLHRVFCIGVPQDDRLLESLDFFQSCGF